MEDFGKKKYVSGFFYLIFKNKMIHGLITVIKVTVHKFVISHE